MAIAYHGLGNNSAARESFEQAYTYSQDGTLLTPFVEGGQAIRSLIKHILDDNQSNIPIKWLQDIDKKAAAYAKKAAIIAAEVRKKHGINKIITLSERENQMLHDICLGLTREEIAATRYLSVNTVKTELKTLYAKLGASSNIDAMRIALEQDLLSDFPKLLT
jgi:LuxR family maltose regulon positive regulatory protein